MVIYFLILNKYSLCYLTLVLRSFILFLKNISHKPKSLFKTHCISHWGILYYFHRRMHIKYYFLRSYDVQKCFIALVWLGEICSDSQSWRLSTKESTVWLIALLSRFSEVNWCTWEYVLINCCLNSWPGI